jgi:PEP-CTERM motif
MSRLKSLSVRKFTLSAIAVGASLVSGARSANANLIQYLVVPPSGTLSNSGVGPQTFYLPGYNGNVSVSITNATGGPAVGTFFDQTNAYNQGAGIYTWQTDTQRFDVYNSNTSTSGGAAPNDQYDFHFDFLNGAPNPADLLLVVCGLASGTTATANQPGSLVGEYTFPHSGFYPAGPSSTTVLTGQTFSSGWTNVSGTDVLNTGWALYQTTGSYTDLTLAVDQIPGDGIGFTVAYDVSSVPEPASMSLLGIGCGALLIRRRRERRPKQEAPMK